MQPALLAEAVEALGSAAFPDALLRSLTGSLPCDHLSVIVFNLDRESSGPVPFSGANAPSGLVELQQLTSANITDTNEDAQVIDIHGRAFKNFDPATPMSLPPYSMTVLRWRQDLAESRIQ